MSRVERIEAEVEALSSEEFARFRAWFLEHDWADWDDELQRDVASGKLGSVAREAAADHASGETSEL